MKKDPESIIQAKSYAFRLLGYRERSAREMADRLEMKGFSKTACGKAVSDLKALGLIDDNKFAKDFARGRLRYRPCGVGLIRSELSAKGVARDIVDSVISDIEKSYDEYEAAHRIANDKASRSRKLDPLKAKRRLHGYLLRRRFKKEIIYTILNEIFSV